MYVFLENKYTNWYFSIIKAAQARNKVDGYCERHHIIPRSLGGSDYETNLVELSAKEHFICHRLLVRMCAGEDKSKMAYAAWQLSRPAKNKDVRITSRTYTELRVHLSESKKGVKRKPFTEQAKRNMSAAKKGKRYAPSEKKIKHLQRITEERGSYDGESNPFYGKRHKEESKKAIGKSSSERFLGKPKIKKPCIHCGKEVAPNMLNRFHMDNCKLKKV